MTGPLIKLGRAGTDRFNCQRVLWEVAKSRQEAGLLLLKKDAGSSSRKLGDPLQAPTPSTKPLCDTVKLLGLLPLPPHDAVEI